MKLISEDGTILFEWLEVSVTTHIETTACDWLKGEIPGISNMDADSSWLKFDGISAW